MISRTQRRRIVLFYTRVYRATRIDGLELRQALGEEILWSCMSMRLSEYLLHIVLINVQGPTDCGTTK
jgi:hypothetical protein